VFYPYFGPEVFCFPPSLPKCVFSYDSCYGYPPLSSDASLSAKVGLLSSTCFIRRDQSHAENIEEALFNRFLFFPVWRSAIQDPFPLGFSGSSLLYCPPVVVLCFPLWFLGTIYCSLIVSLIVLPSLYVPFYCHDCSVRLAVLRAHGTSPSSPYDITGSSPTFVTVFPPFFH